MATSNFKTMRKFPLIAVDEQYQKICPECGCGQADNAEKCEECGCDLADVERVYDDCYAEYMYKEMQKVADRLTKAQPFYEVSVESGHYCGAQFYVEEKYWKIEQMDNDESQDEFGMCRSVMLRKYKSATSMLCRELRKAKDELGLMELEVSVRFSNGETWYDKVG